MQLTQEEIENTIADILKHGDREMIARNTGIYPKIVDAFFNPHDERKSPHYQVLHIQAVLDEKAPAVGSAVWQAMNAMRAASCNGDLRRRKMADVTAELHKEASDVFISGIRELPYTDQLREISELKAKLDEYEKAVIYTHRVGEHEAMQ